MSTIAKILKRQNWRNDILVRTKGLFDIMIIDEHPSIEEDKKAVWCDAPFQSDNGAKFLEYTTAANFNLERTYVTYLTKCAPPYKRKPTSKEITACFGHIVEEIKSIQPKVIILCGNASLRLFKLQGEGGVMTVRGNIYKKKLPAWEDGPEFLVIPTIRPLMFTFKDDPALEARVIDDFRLANQLVGNPCYRPEEFKIDFEVLETIDQIDEVVKEIKDAKHFAFDTESRSNFWYKDPMIMLQMSYYKGKEIKNVILPRFITTPELYDKKDPEAWLLRDVWTEEQKQIISDKLKVVFEDKKITKCGHNIKYDMCVLLNHMGIKVEGFLYDSMILHHLLWEARPHDLKTLADIEFKCGDYDSELLDIVGHGKKKLPYDLIPMPIFYKYSAADSYFTLKLVSTYYDRIRKKDHLWKVYVNESEPGIHALFEAEWHGTLISQEVVDRQIAKYTEKLMDILRDCRADTWPEFNPSSPDDVTKALIRKGFGDQIRDKTTASGYRTDKKTLMNLNNCPLADRVLEYRHDSKLLTTYFERAKTEVDFGGRFHTGFLQHGTETGRLSASLLHQIPKLNKVKAREGIEQPRHMFVAQKGYKYLYGDFSQVELYILALIAKDDVMLKAVEGDLHSISAAAFLNMSVEEFKAHPEYDFNRTEVGKKINFGLAYGSEGFSLVKTGKWKDEHGKEHPITWDMLNSGMAKWRAQFPGVADYLATYPDWVRQNNGIAVTVFGRERRFGSRMWHRNKFERERAEREAINFTIQSAAGALTNRTINLVYKEVQNQVEQKIIQPSDMFLVNTVHDSIAYEVRDELLDWAKETVKRIATREIPELGNFKFKMDLGVGDSWASAEMRA